MRNLKHSFKSLASYFGLALSNLGVLSIISALFAFTCNAVILVFVTGIPVLALLVALAISLPVAFRKIDPGAILQICTLVGLSNTCGQGNTGGINSFWLIPKDDIIDIAFDADGKVTGFTLSPGKVFYKYDHEDDTASLTQPLTINKNNISIKQTLLWINPYLDQTKRNELMNLIECSLCGIIGIVRDNNSKYWVVGISYNGVEWMPKALKAITAEGAVTGADSESDANQFTHALESKNNEYAREFDGVEADITVTGSGS